MAIYTGNNGRMYLARAASSALAGERTLSIVRNQAISNGQVLSVQTVQGTGSGAQFRATNSVALNATSRSCNFRVRSGGSNYQDSDVVYLARYSQNTLVRMTSNFSVGSVLTIGVDDERELTVDNYRVAKIRDWTFNSNSEVIETTALGDTVKTFAPSATSGEGTATLLFYEDDLNDSGTAGRDIFELAEILFPRDVPPRVIMGLAIDGGSFLVDSANLGKTNFVFNAYITSASVSVSYGEVVAVSTNFTVDGQLLDIPWKPGIVGL